MGSPGTDCGFNDGPSSVCEDLRGPVPVGANPSETHRCDYGRSFAVDSPSSGGVRGVHGHDSSVEVGLWWVTGTRDGCQRCPVPGSQCPRSFLALPLTLSPCFPGHQWLWVRYGPSTESRSSCFPSQDKDRGTSSSSFTTRTQGV